MNPLRLIVLSILFYILYRLIFGGKEKRRKKMNEEKAAQGSLAAHDILVEDPVCHTYIPKSESVVLKRDKQTWHFCSTGCRESFIKEKGDQS